MTVLAPMTEHAYTAFMRASIPDFAREKVLSGQWSEAESLELARAGFEALLPQGMATPDNHFFEIRTEDGRQAVGALWFAVQDHAGRKVAYVYDVVVYPEHRKMGHAIRAFAALETVATALGLAGIALHVFGFNAAARALYEKLGFRATNINMFKPVGGSPEAPIRP